MSYEKLNTGTGYRGMSTACRLDETTYSTRTVLLCDDIERFFPKLSSFDSVPVPIQYRCQCCKAGATRTRIISQAGAGASSMFRYKFMNL
jgi:hypothetical protein